MPVFFHAIHIMCQMPGNEPLVVQCAPSQEIGMRELVSFDCGREQLRYMRLPLAQSSRKEFVHVSNINVLRGPKN